MKLKNNVMLCFTAAITLSIFGCGSTSEPISKSSVLVPADKFDLSHWKITVPVDLDDNGKIDEINVKRIQNYRHRDFFYLNDDGHMVFVAPNKAITTANSSNTRSELRHMLGGKDVDTKSPENNFVIKAHKNASDFAQIGGNLQATVKVNHVAKRATHSKKKPTYSVVVGQIHAEKSKDIVSQGEGYGWGNEPLKIYYKKWPGHKYGSVFWNYERNLEKNNSNRKDIAYPVWGHLWDNASSPKESGIALDEEFSYEVNVYQNIMYLTFTTERHGAVKYEIDLANNVDANGKVDALDHPNGYSGDVLYFKAGAYNQCSTKNDSGFWYPKCLGTGDWKTDKANGDYTQVTFTRLIAGEAKVPN
jgi:poly(beta-D-mannuronate) lyase